MHLFPKLLVTTSKALVTRSDALVTNSFLLLLVRHLLLEAMHLLLVASIASSSKLAIQSFPKAKLSQAVPSDLWPVEGLPD